MVTWTDIKDGLTYLPRAVATDSRRVLDSTLELGSTGSTTVNADRRDAIKVIGGFAAGGFVDYTEDGDLDSYDVAADVAGSTGNFVGEFVQVDVDPLGPFSEGESGSRRDVGDTGDTRDGSGGINNYSRFEAGLKNQDSESLSYLEGALEADPGGVDEVSFESDGLYVDSVLAEWGEMDNSTRNYLQKAEKSGDLDEWLTRYEEENL